MSEHSIEFGLVYQLTEILSDKWNVTPLYFWRTREGNTWAQKCSHSEEIRTLAVFPRRPKIEYVDEDTIELKVNESVQEEAARLESAGIPTFYGAPLISNLLSYNLISEYMWFYVKNYQVDFNDTVLKVSKSSRKIMDGYNFKYIEIIDEHKIREFANKSIQKTLTDIIKTIKQVMDARKNANPFQRFLFYGNVYKPIFLLLQRHS